MNCIKPSPTADHGVSGHQGPLPVRHSGDDVRLESVGALGRFHTVRVRGGGFLGTWKVVQTRIDTYEIRNL